MAIVSYNGKILRPAPFVSISYNPVRDGRNAVISNNFDISLQATILANKGSPKIDGTFADVDSDFCEVITNEEWTGALTKKFCTLETLFNTDYQELSIGVEGSGVLTAFPRKVSSAVTDTTNPQFWTYTVDLQADNIYCEGTPLVPTGVNSHILSYDETWNIDQNTDGFFAQNGMNILYSISHSISVQGADITNNSGLIQTGSSVAKDFVCARINSNSTVPDNCAYYNSDGYRYNYSESHSIDVANGSYSVSEIWTYCSGDAFEEYTIDHQTDIKGCDTATITGTITGYDVRNSGSVPSNNSRYYNAKTLWTTIQGQIFSRLNTFTGQYFNSDPMSTSVGRNPYTGVITYAYSWDQHPPNLLAEAKMENIKVANTWDEDIFATISILDKGEIIQKINNTASKSYTTALSIEAFYPCMVGPSWSRTSPRDDAVRASGLQSVVDMYNPVVAYPGSTVVISSQTEDWSPSHGMYNYNISWVWQPSGVC